ncbi:transporter substrate-binding domain-containing protein [Candidatus Dependentiae bacterium]|nr:transporter substrate-binding domain-containing protein [Candidatus Dependentiae bacterium]
MQKSKIILTTATAIIIAGIIGIFFRPQQKSTDSLVVGMMSGWPPFMAINNNGEFVGFDVDVAKELANKLNKKLVIKDFGSLAPLFLALEQGKIDIIMSGLDITKARQAKLTMIPYTGETIRSFSLLFWNKIPAEIKQVEDIKNIPNAIICAEPGSAQEKYLNQFNFINKKPLASVSDMILDIRYGKSLAAILETSLAKRLQKQEPAIQILSVPLPEDFMVFGMGIAVKKTNTALSSQISKAITEFKKKDTLQQLETTWNLGA